MPLTTCAQDIIHDVQPGSNGELPEEFWGIVEQYRGELMNQALALLGNLEDAEDAVQETFCEAFRNSGKLKDLRSLGAWLRTVNQGNALDRLRHKKRESKRVDKKRQEGTDPNCATGGFSLLETRELVAKAVEKLPAKMRTVVVLCYWDHFTPDQIAARLQISPRSVRRILLDASLRLFTNLNPQLQFPKAIAPMRKPGISSLEGGKHD